MAHQVFVCHSSRDKSVADAVCAALEARGMPCWIAPRDVLAGLEYGEAIVDAISSCRIVVLIFSAHANDSPQVRREIERAVSKEKTVVPFRIENVLPSRAMEYALSNTHWLDAISPPIEQHMPELCRTVLALTQRSPRAGSLSEPQSPIAPTAAATARSTPETDSRGQVRDAAVQKLRRIGPSRWSLIAWAIAAVAGIIAAAVGVTAWLAPAQVSGPLDSTQITSSADSKQGPLFTDGTRLYFNSGGEPAEMAVGGGIIAPAHIFGPAFKLLDISADGSKALALSKDLNDETERGTLWTESTLGGTPRKLSDHLSLTARWAPDGRSIVFADQHTLYRIDEDGGNLTRIWEAPGDVLDVSFSSDARLLSVSVSRGAMHGDPRLWQLEAGGAKAHPIALDWPITTDELSGRWTPDGSHFVFLSDQKDFYNVYELITPRWYEFWKKPAAVRITGNQLNIVGVAPARDSKSLFVLGRPDQGSMQALDSQTAKFVPYLDGLSALAFVISPDRQWMAYVEYPTDFLWKCRLDGSERTQLTSFPAFMPQWSPDGKSLAYSNWHHIFVVSAGGGTPEMLVSDTGSKEGSGIVMPSWSHDGTSIAWSYFPLPNRPFTGIHLLDLASRQNSILAGSEGYYAPSWSPDGRYLVAIAQKPARMMLYSAAAKTWKDLQQFDASWGYYAWSSDSKSIYMSMTHEQNGIYRLGVPGGDWKRISGLDGLNDLSGDAFLSLTPDGRPAIMSRTGVAQVYSLNWKP